MREVDIIKEDMNSSSFVLVICAFSISLCHYQSHHLNTVTHVRALEESFFML